MNPNRITFICGASGSGKTSHAIATYGRAPKLWVYDPDREWCRLPGMVEASSGVQMVQAARVGAPRVAYTGDRREMFALWCDCVLLLSDRWAHMTALVDELAGVTTPSKAAESWHTLVTRGRKRGVHLIGCAQRPAEVDKTIIGNAALIHAGRLMRAQDRQYIALEMDAPIEIVSSLLPYEWIERDRTKAGALITGRVILRNGVPVSIKTRPKKPAKTAKNAR